MNTIWIIPLEPIDQRYTKQWYHHIPLYLAEKIQNFSITQIEVEGIPETRTPGAFLDFAYTNVYKAKQLAAVAGLFSDNKIKNGDKFLVTDAWNPSILSIKYMAELLNINVEIHAIWHAGSYDPTDILGLKMNKSWSYPTEVAIYNACDYNYFATEFHRDMFIKNLSITNDSKAFISGQPYNYLITDLLSTPTNKSDIVVFTHRLNTDKQPDIFRHIASILEDEYNIHSVITQELNLTKEDYYATLRESKVSFSCSLHENLGIGMLESLYCGAIPIVPNRASYSEIYKDFTYNSKWTEDEESFMMYYVEAIVELIVHFVRNYDEISKEVLPQLVQQSLKFMSPDVMVEKLDILGK